jgi:hypothetical protein
LRKGVEGTVYRTLTVSVSTFVRYTLSSKIGK